MFKLIRVFNIEEEKNEIKSADYDVIYEFDRFDYDKHTESMLISVCKEKNLPYDDNYSIIEYKDNRPIAVVGQLFYHAENDEIESWMNMAEWKERVIASVALGYDIVLSEETKKKYAIKQDDFIANTEPELYIAAKFIMEHMPDNLKSKLTKKDVVTILELETDYCELRDIELEDVGGC